MILVKQDQGKKHSQREQSASKQPLVVEILTVVIIVLHAHHREKDVQIDVCEVQDRHKLPWNISAQCEFGGSGQGTQHISTHQEDFLREIYAFEKVRNTRKDCRHSTFGENYEDG